MYIIINYILVKGRSMKRERSQTPSLSYRALRRALSWIFLEFLFFECVSLFLELLDLRSYFFQGAAPNL